MVNELSPGPGCLRRVDHRTRPSFHHNPTVSTQSVRLASLKNHNLIEPFFNRIKPFRRIAMRHDELADSFSSFVYLA